MNKLKEYTNDIIMENEDTFYILHYKLLNKISIKKKCYLIGIFIIIYFILFQSYFFQI